MRVKEIIDYKVLQKDKKDKDSKQIFYLVVWSDGRKEWRQDTDLIGSDKAIEAFFTKNYKDELQVEMMQEEQS